MNDKTIELTEDAIKEYLDKCITIWRKKRDNEPCDYAKYYIDAFQSVRMSLFNELLE